MLSQSASTKRGLLSALVRTIEPHGTVRIDAQDIKLLGLHDLREKIMVVSKVRVKIIDYDSAHSPI